MQLILERFLYSDLSTIGHLLVDGQWECQTLEDRWRPKGVKVPKTTCIPAGTYRVVIAYSPKHKRDLPLLQNVPGFWGIEIHVGNTPKDTSGCILVGSVAMKDKILESTIAFNHLWTKIMRAWEAKENIFITITDDEKHTVPQMG